MNNVLKKNKLKQANRLFCSGDYKKALDTYKLICQEYPEFARFIEFNMIQARKKIEYNEITLSENCFSSANECFLTYSDCRKTEVYQWMSREIEIKINNNEKPIKNSLVSIIVPARNSEAYIEQTLSSLLHQSYKNIEILVIDDFSDDNTANIAVKLSRQDRRIRYQRVNANLGTYFARSYGVSLARGEYITFQDADDFSHENRIELHLREAQNNNKQIVTSNYVRIDPLSGKIVEFHGKSQHYGFITTFASRKIFSEIGCFDITSRGGDAEFSYRISRFIEKSKISHIPCPSYMASDLPGSLSHGEVNRSVSDRNSALSFPRSRYAKNFHTISQTFKSKAISKELFNFPMLRSPYRLPYLLAGADLREYQIIGCICTIPSRMAIFKTVFDSIVNQVDILFVYPDKYNSELPDFLKLSSKVKILSIQDNPNLRDAAKFLPLQSELSNHKLDRTIIFTFDDDILYPPDYVHSMVQRLRALDFYGVVGVHGAILKENFQDFRTDRKVFHFSKELQQELFVDILGTGTVAFRADLLYGKFGKDDIHPGMIDISLAKVCRYNLIPLCCISRHTGWLVDLTKELVDDSSLWNELVQDSTPHTSTLKLLSNNAWGEAAIKNLFVDRHVIFSDNSASCNFFSSLSTEEKIPTRLRISLPKPFIYRITVTVTNNEKLDGEIILRSSITGQDIYKRKLVNCSVSFLCNGAINKNVSIDFSAIESNWNPIEATLKIDPLFDASLPKEFYSDSTSITACLATYPPRENCFNDVIESVLPQVDNFCVYFNRYSSIPSSISEILLDKEKERAIHFILDYDGTPKASGKFRWLDRDGYIFIIDDDINYPSDYFSHLLGWIEKFDKKSFIGVHGVVFNENVSSFHFGEYSSISKKYNFSEVLHKITRVHLIGTGTLAFHSSLIENYRKELYDLLNFNSGYENANDECLAVFARKKEIPMHIVPRRLDWLTSNKKMKYGIYEDHFNDSELSMSVTKLLSEGNPWPKIVNSQ
jgi:glycosyltransferase involved in cell wall biosynthesis